MRFVLAPFGSRGDVEPVLALGARLIERGHDAVLCAPPNFRESAREIGLEFRSAGPDFGHLFDGSQSNMGLFLSSLRETLGQFEALLDAARDADLILGVALQFAAPTVAEMLGLPYRYAVFSPMYLRAPSLPSLAFGAQQIPPIAQRFLWKMEDAMQLPKARWLADTRRDLGLPAVTSLHHYLLGSAPPLGAFDPFLAPMPPDAIRADVTGYWRREVNGPLPPDLSDFLARGAPPVYMGFGSMKHRDSAALFRALIQATIASGRRIVIGRGWSQQFDPVESELCFMVDEVPHHLLFPLVAVAIHHGGAGTTLAAATAGVPQIIVPHLGDQYYHGLRVATLGIGPDPIPFKRLSPTALVRALDKVAHDARYSAKAREFAPQLRAREGSSRAADLLERIAR